MYDVLIIGAGVIGSAIARKLSSYNLAVAVLEKENDVAMGSSKANSAIVHGGYAESASTLRGKLCYEGRKQFSALSSALYFEFLEIGSLVIARSDDEMTEIHKLYKNGLTNGLSDLSLLSRTEVLAKEPNVHPDVLGALYCKGAGVTNPYGYTIALMENAIKNGVKLFLKTKVVAIDKTLNDFAVHTDGENGKQTFQSRFIVNAAGVSGETVAKLIGVQDIALHPRSGQYIIMRTGTGKKVNHVVFQAPSPMGKGILVTPTYRGNLLLGPDALDENIESENTDVERLYHIFHTALESIPSLTIFEFLRSFAGVRAVPEDGDFILREEKKVPRFIQAVGIQSPGITSSPAIATVAVSLLETAGLILTKKETYTTERIDYGKNLYDIDAKEVEQRIAQKEGESTRLVCRCERVLEQTMRQALQGGIPFESVDGMKRRTRASMGLCQGSFCTGRTKAVMERVLKKEVSAKTDIVEKNVIRVTKTELLAYFRAKGEIE